MKFPIISFSQKSEYLVLGLILCFAFYMTFIPHLDSVYPLHVDEWSNYGLSQAVLLSGNIIHEDPFLGERIIRDHPEIGFHVLLAIIKLVTGVSWLSIYQFLPSVLFVLATLSAFIVGKRLGCGLEAAFFITLIPTTVRFLGPAFLVPVALGIPVIMMLIFLLHNAALSVPKAIILFLFSYFLCLVHPPTAAAAVLIGSVYALAIAYSDWKMRVIWWRHSVMILGVLFGSMMTLIPRYSNLIAEVTEDIDVMLSGDIYPLPLVYDALIKFGYIPLGLFVIGVWFLSTSGKVRSYALLTSGLVFLGILAVFSHFRIGSGLMYDRSWLYFFLFASIFAGFGVKEIRRIGSRYYKGPFSHLAAVLGMVAVFLPTMIFGVKGHHEERYYHIISDDEYAAFTWIGINMGSEYGTVLADPWPALALPPLAVGKEVYTYSAFIPGPERANRISKAREFLASGGTDTQWLEENEIRIIFSWAELETPDLEKIRGRVYIRRK